MASNRQKYAGAVVPPRRQLTGWAHSTVSTVEDMGRLLEDVVEASAAQGYSSKDRFSVRLALEEAIVNAIKHGHRHDPAKRVSVRYRVRPDCIRVSVRDQGAGFDLAQVADPLAPENLDRPCGRGLLLMRAYMTSVCHNARGNGVTLCKQRSL